MLISMTENVSGVKILLKMSFISSVICALYSDLRSSLFNSIQVEIGNIGTFSPEEKFVKIMNSNNTYLYRYVEEAWKLRKKGVFENNVS